MHILGEMSIRPTIEQFYDQKNQNSSPFTDCTHSFAFWQGLKESVDNFCMRAEKYYISLLSSYPQEQLYR